MARVTSTQSQRKFGDLKYMARREPVDIEERGRREFVLSSADHYDWLKAAVARTHRTSEAPQLVIDAVKRAEMDPRHAALDDLMK